MDIVNTALIRKGMSLKEDTKLVAFFEEDIPAIKNRSQEKFINEAACFAAANNVYLVPGLYIKDNYLCLCLIDNTGHVAGEQRATHLNSAWFGGLSKSTDINIISTPFGKLFLCPDVDIYKPEVLRIAAMMGAEIVICSQYIATNDFREEMILAGAWQQAQQNCIYMMDSTNVASSIIGPCTTVDDLSGYMARTSNKTPLYAEFSAAKRKQAYDIFPIFKSLNLKLYKNHIDQLCDW